MNIETIFLPFFSAVLLSFLATPFVIRLAHHFHLIDDPKKRYHPASVHTEKIPRAGGLAILIGLLGGMLFLPKTGVSLSIFASSIILVGVGLLDDYRDIHPYIRLLTNAFCVLLVLASHIAIPYITNPFGSGVIQLTSPVSLLISFIWIYWVMNVIGWSAGVDGQLPGVVVIAAIVLGVLSLRYSLIDPTQSYVTILAAIVAGSFLGFTPWNFYPQKIMPGYGGKTLAGFLLAVLGILSYAKLGTAILVLGIPMADATFTLFRRFSKGKSLVVADRGHLHHSLLDLGVSKRMIALSYWLFSAILGAVALSVTSSQKIFVLLLVAVVFFGFILWINWVLRYSKKRDRDSG